MQFFVKFAPMDFKSVIHPLVSLIEQSDNIAIVTHEHPDGDAAGSSSALAHYFKHLGKSQVSLIREPLPSTLSFIDTQPTLYGDEAIEALKSADVIFCTDFCDPNRAGGVPGEAIEMSPAKKVLIDHHVGAPLEKYDLAISRTDVSSASELVYFIIKRLLSGLQKEKEFLFSGACGYYLMVGMTTDTNNFACATYSSTLRMASDLVNYGINRNEIISQLYNNYRENRVRAMAFILSERLEIREDGLAILKVSEEDWHKFGLREGELEGLVNIPLSIDRVKVSLYLREDGSIVRASVRSKRDYSARTMARTYFHGGGHELASGGKLYIGTDIPAFAEIDEYLKKVNI